MKILATIFIALFQVVAWAQTPFSLSDYAFIGSGSSLVYGCAAYWQLEEGVDQLRMDRTHNGNFLTSSASVGVVPGKVGNAANFTFGTLQKLYVATNASLLFSGSSFSMALWLYPTNISGAFNPISQYDFGNNQKAWTLFFDNSTSKLQFYVSANGSTATSVTANTYGALSANVWVWIYAYYDVPNNQIGISVNNGTADTAAFSSTLFTSSAAICVGASLNNGIAANITRGYIDEVGLWSRLLTTSEKARLYNSGNGSTWPKF